MSKKVKSLIERELKSRFENVGDCIVVSLRGVSGIDNNQMRGEFLKKDIHMAVVKNSLARRAFSDLSKEPINEFLVGPSAIVYGGESVVDLAKELVGWDKKLDVFQIKGSMVEGAGMGADATKALAKMPNRAELLASLVMLSQSPGRRLAGSISSPAVRIAGCIKSLIEKLEAA